MTDETRLETGNDNQDEQRKPQNQTQDYEYNYEEPVAPRRPRQQRETAQEAYFNDDADGEEMVITNPKGLIKALESYKGEAKEARKFFKELGLAPEEIKDLAKFKQQRETEKKEAEEKDLELKKQYAQLFENRLSSATEEYEKQMTQQQKRNQALEKRNQELESQLAETTNMYKTHILKNKVKDAYLNNGGNNTVDEETGENTFDIFWDRYGTRFNLLDDQDSVEIYDRTRKNIAVDKEGNALDIGGFIDGLKGSNVGRMFFEGYAPQGNATPTQQHQPRVTNGNKPEVMGTNGVIDLAGSGYDLDDIINGKVQFRQNR